MLNNQIFYHATIRKTIVAFGRLFSDIYIHRREGDSVSGPIAQTLQIPIAYGPKEKWLVRLEQDPTLENHTYISLPRMSFEILGYAYDSQRKLNKVQKISCVTEDGSSHTLTPVPYNLEISLYILTKTQEDGMQIVEQILPTFSPDYNLAIKVVPEMNIIQNVPVILNGVQVSDDYEGDFQTRRFVTHTLSFTLKLNLFGNVSSSSRIYTANANVGTTFPNINSRFSVQADPSTGEILDEGWDFDL